MNSCILMAKIVKTPELRYTQDNQTAVTQMLVEFAGQRPDDPPGTLKVVGWGNLATEMQQNYTEGDQVIIHGRLQINSFDRTEGFKEKRAELTVSHIYKVGSLDSYTSSNSSETGSLESKVVPINTKKTPKPTATQNDQDLVLSSVPTSVDSYQNLSESSAPPNLDDIPF